MADCDRNFDAKPAVVYVRCDLYYENRDVMNDDRRASLIAGVDIWRQG